MTLRRRFSVVILIVLGIGAMTAILFTTFAPTSGAAANSKIAARVLNETAHGAQVSTGSFTWDFSTGSANNVLDATYSGTTTVGFNPEP